MTGVSAAKALNGKLDVLCNLVAACRVERKLLYYCVLNSVQITGTNHIYIYYIRWEEILEAKTSGENWKVPPDIEAEVIFDIIWDNYQLSCISMDIQMSERNKEILNQLKLKRESLKNTRTKELNHLVWLKHTHTHNNAIKLYWKETLTERKRMTT